MPEVLILTGPPASGKSSVARALSDRYDRVAHIEVDTLRHFITPTGYVAPGRPGFEHQQRLATRNAWALAANFLAEHFAVIIDDVIVARAELDYYIEGLRHLGVPVHLVRLMPSLQACLKRNALRKNDRISPERVEAVWREVEASAIDGMTIDSTELSVEETADKLQALTTSSASLIVKAPAKA